VAILNAKVVMRAEDICWNDRSEMGAMLLVVRPSDTLINVDLLNNAI
jgi:hypothetical protein